MKKFYLFKTAIIFIISFAYFTTIFAFSVEKKPRKKKIVKVKKIKTIKIIQNAPGQSGCIRIDSTKRKRNESLFQNKIVQIVDEPPPSPKKP